MKIGILTFHAPHNYGSMLQNWALQHVLSQMFGGTVETINLRIEEQKRMFFNPIGKPGKRTVLQFFKHPRNFIGNTIKWYKFEKFIKEDLLLSNNEYISWEKLSIDLKTEPYDAIICGGDQIWNLTCEDFSEAYFLPMKFKHTKKLSYSPSLGGYFSLIESHHLFESLKRWISDFDVLTVREKDSAEYLSKILNKEVMDAPDPTLLLNADDYNPLISGKPLIEGNYMLYYTPYPSPEAEKVAIEAAKRLGIRIITSNGTDSMDGRIYQHNNVGPKEFLNLVKHANYICGKSFHLLVFSLLFHKRFSIIDGNRDSRMKMLLENCGINGGYIDHEQPDYSVLSETIDYQAVDEVLQNICKRGRDIIQSWTNIIQ